MTNNITYKHKDLYDLLTDKTPPNVPDYRELAFPIPPGGLEPFFPTPPGVEMELVGINKQELARLKKLEAQVLLEASTCRRNPVLDCQTIVKKLLQVKPELKDWLEVNFKEYL